jgi:methylenetetrahydrofolate dehydrogenase (NADP+)/methenyltetrahydrofolate cyclohydrolase
MAEAELIDGKATAADLRARVGRAVAGLKAAHGLTPGLAVVLAGEDPASHIYVRNKAKQTVEAGMNSFEHRLDETVSQDDLLALLDKLNNDARVHGILVQLPLPDQIDAARVIDAIDPDKDVDGFHVINAGRLMTGQPGLVPCTPVGCVILAKQAVDSLEGLNAVIVGRSNIVGKPLAHLLLKENCTVTLAHSRTRDLAAVCRGADLLGDGKAKLVGDVDFDEVRKVAGAITPVPGGVGPMTIACLLANTLTACARQAGVTPPEL